MSLELLNECKKKLVNSVSRLDKIMEMYDSTPLEKCFYDCCKYDSVIKETRDTLSKNHSESQKTAQKYLSFKIDSIKFAKNLEY